MSYINYKPISHAIRVLRLYRAAIKNLQSYYLTDRSPSCQNAPFQRRSRTRVKDILDTWHPFEKARYPKYFALREKRKHEIVENARAQRTGY
ncbi:uncharacterized protein LOC115229524 [Octopus sinensis]|uniref:Uncharacterized protein LOC115229524 n=1 Tax=Octopus sinensis TaxID=2607531 RepID=A0A6P7TVB3_9MOLL|nr:uncharacterized protein LOC115229524 [Octopus sinensis]